jgi:hypothetical protein
MKCLNCDNLMTLTAIIRRKNCTRCEYECPACGFTDVAFERVRPAAMTQVSRRKRRTMKQRRLDTLRIRRWKIITAMRRHGLIGEAKSA